MIVQENALILRRYKLKYSEMKGYAYNLISGGPPHKTHIIYRRQNVSGGSIISEQSDDVDK